MRILKPHGEIPKVQPESTPAPVVTPPAAAKTPPAPIPAPVPSAPALPVSPPKPEEPSAEAQALAREAKALESALQDDVTARLAASRQTMKGLLDRLSAVETPAPPSATAEESKRIEDLLEVHRKKVETLEKAFHEEQKRLQQALQQKDSEMKSVAQEVAATKKTVDDLKSRPIPAPLPAPAIVPPVVSKPAPEVPKLTPEIPKAVATPEPPKLIFPTPLEETLPDIPLKLDWIPQRQKKQGWWSRFMTYLNGTAVEIPVKKKRS